MAKTPPTALMRPVCVHLANGKPFGLADRRRADDVHVQRNPTLWVDAGLSDDELLAVVRERHRGKAAADREREEKAKASEPARYSERLKRMNERARKNNPSYGFYRS